MNLGKLFKRRVSNTLLGLVQLRSSEQPFCVHHLKMEKDSRFLCVNKLNKMSR